jgi:hypothetical protein
VTFWSISLPATVEGFDFVFQIRLLLHPYPDYVKRGELLAGA